MDMHKRTRRIYRSLLGTFGFEDTRDAIRAAKGCMDTAALALCDEHDFTRSEVVMLLDDPFIEF